MDHDQRFKNLIKVFFKEFLLLFFKEWAARLDVGAVEWLDKEVFPEPPEGPRSMLDLVGKLPTRQVAHGQRPGESDQWLALVHIEIESPDKATPLRPRMFDAYVQLRRHHRLPVLPIGMFLQVGLDGTGIDVYEEWFWELRLVRFEYLLCGLAGSGCVRICSRRELAGRGAGGVDAHTAGAGCLARRGGPETHTNGAPERSTAVPPGGCVQVYLPLDETQQREFERLVTIEPYKGVQAMNTTWYEKGVEKGVEKERA